METHFLVFRLRVLETPFCSIERYCVQLSFESTLSHIKNSLKLLHRGILLKSITEITQLLPIYKKHHTLVRTSGV